MCVYTFIPAAHTNTHININISPLSLSFDEQKKNFGSDGKKKYFCHFQHLYAFWPMFSAQFCPSKETVREIFLSLLFIFIHVRVLFKIYILLYYSIIIAKVFTYYLFTSLTISKSTSGERVCVKSFLVFGILYHQHILSVGHYYLR